jgi:hypothetical protein
MGLGEEGGGADDAPITAAIARIKGASVGFF